jgi:GPH family glycoside/pentoside/hexuronide:cation symporter
MKDNNHISAKVSPLEQFGYFCGDFGGSLVNLYISAFYLTFCTYVLKISPAFMALLFFWARIWDAINDPMIGSLPDRFRIGKSGKKFIPWVRVFMVPLAISGILCFTDVSNFPELFKHVWVCVVYILYGMAYTGTSMPYGAMASVITDDPIERTKLSRARSFGGIGVGMLFIPVVSLMIWDKEGNPVASGYFIMAIAAGILSVIFYIMLTLFSKERIQQEHKFAKTTGAAAATGGQKYSFFRSVKEAFTNRAMIGIMVATIGSMFLSVQSMQSYLFREYYHMPRAMSLTSIIGLPAMIVAFFFVPKLAKKFGSRKFIIMAAVYTMVAYGILFFIPIPNVYAFMAINSIAGLGSTVFVMLVWAMVTEAIDYQEYKSGDRSDGTLFSIYTFSRKIGSALTASISTALIGAVGFVAGAKVQPEGFGENVRKLLMGMPAIGAILILIGIGLIYPLTQKKSAEMHEALHAKREAELAARQAAGEE